MPVRSPARYAPTPMPIPPKITTSRAMLANPRRISDLLRLASVSTMPPRCEGLMKERRRSRRAPPCDDAACERGARDPPSAVDEGLHRGIRVRLGRRTPRRSVRAVDAGTARPGPDDHRRRRLLRTDLPAGRHRERGRLAHPEHLSDIEISVGGGRGLPDR